MTSSRARARLEEAQNFLIPMVIEKTGRGERAYDIYSRLLEDRIVFIGTQIDDQVANAVMAQLLFLDKTGRSQDIKMYINSPGGSVTAGLAIYDTMQLIEPPIQTYCLGQAASMGAVLLAGGAAAAALAAASGERRCSSCRIELQISMHSLQMYTPGGPAMSDATLCRRFSQNVQRSTCLPRPVEEVMISRF